MGKASGDHGIFRPGASLWPDEHSALATISQPYIVTDRVRCMHPSVPMSLLPVSREASHDFVALYWPPATMLKLGKKGEEDYMRWPMTMR